MKNKNILFTMFLVFVILSLGIISSLETTQISYIQKITYIPYCNTLCTSNVTTNSTTNYTTNNTECISGCYGVFNMSLIFSGDTIPRTYEINTSSSLYKNGADFMVPGYYLATLGNTSDVTGINDKISNLTITINKNLIDCFTNNSAIQSASSISQNICNAQVNSVNQNNTNLNIQVIDLDKKSKQRLYYAIGFFILGILAVKFGEPYLKGRNTKKDPNEAGTSPYEGRY